jgi:hypothetical protein
MAAWPDTLPTAPNQDGFQEDPPNNLIRTAMDIGLAKLRRRSTSAPRFITCAYDLTKAQVGYLETFYITTTYDGADPFTWTHPRTAGTLTVRFAAPPSYLALDFQIRAVIVLEVAP